MKLDPTTLPRKLITGLAGVSLAASMMMIGGCEPQTPPPQEPPPGQSTDHMDRQTEQPQDDRQLRDDDRYDQDRGRREDDPRDDHIDPPGLMV